MHYIFPILKEEEKNSKLGQYVDKFGQRRGHLSRNDRTCLFSGRSSLYMHSQAGNHVQIISDNILVMTLKLYFDFNKINSDEDCINLSLLTIGNKY